MMKPSAPEPQRELDPRLVLKPRARRQYDPEPPVESPIEPPYEEAVAPTRIVSATGEVIDLRTPEELLVRPDVEPVAIPRLPAALSPRARLLRWTSTSLPLAKVAGWTSSNLPLAVVLAVAVFFRFWRLSQVGYNSDEAVYAGTAASMAGHTDYSGMFPVFRAHPLLFQTLMSLLFRHEVSDWSGRALAAAAGVGAVGATYAVGRRLYGPLCGSIAGLLLAVMPYHVIVSRQVLLDGPMTLFATITLYCLVRYCEAANWRWMLAAGGALGVTVLSKETSAILLGSIYAFFALTPAIRLRVRHLLGGLVIFGSLVAVFPIVVRLSGRSSAGQSYLLWQLGRPANHPMFFYADVIPAAVGILTLVAALLGLIVLRRNLDSWRERLLLAWIAVPATFFTIWPLKGYQYLLPIAPAVTVLAARGIVALYWIPWPRHPRRVWLRRATVIAAAMIAAGSLVGPAWALINPSSSGTFLAGTGGVPGGREAGLWLKANAPANSQLLSIGPSMANILQFYGQHRTFGLSVSSNPRDRNPAYQPIANPDRWVREGLAQFVVWDSYTANRTPFFAAKITALAKRYHGVAVFTATVPVRTPSGARTRNPVVIIYQVRPA
jgi:hypothetical protein